MSEQDQNQDADATRFIPSPRTSNRSNEIAEAKIDLSNLELNESSSVDLDAINGLNPLIACANPILSIIPKIKALPSHPNPKGLRDSFAEKIVKFEQLAGSRGIKNEDILIARYALCTFIDETIASTPWGATAELANKTLLVTFHKEAWGGEKFYQILNKLAENPASKIDLIELQYICLLLGFEGRFKIVDNGKFELQSLRDKVGTLIQNVRGQSEKDLSGNWRGENTQRVKTKNFFSLWLALLFVSILLMIIFAAMAIDLASENGQIPFGAVKLVKPKVEAPKQRTAPKLTQFLQPEIQAGLVVVEDSANTSKVSIVGDRLFESGNAMINQDYYRLLERIANALNEVQGQVLVTGHTDNKPSRSIRFPSNWHLSKSRAENVAAFLVRHLKNAERIHYEGRGEAEPIAPNDSDVNRAKNRRVEILLKVTG